MRILALTLGIVLSISAVDIWLTFLSFLVESAPYYELYQRESEHHACIPSHDIHHVTSEAKPAPHTYLPRPPPVLPPPLPR